MSEETLDQGWSLTREELIWTEGGRTYYPDKCRTCIDYEYCKQKKHESTNINPDKNRKRCFIHRESVDRDSVEPKEVMEESGVS